MCVRVCLCAWARSCAYVCAYVRLLYICIYGSLSYVCARTSALAHVCARTYKGVCACVRVCVARPAHAPPSFAPHHCLSVAPSAFLSRGALGVVLRCEGGKGHDHAPGPETRVVSSGPQVAVEPPRPPTTQVGGGKFPKPPLGQLTVPVSGKLCG